jgi:hypothetical protein
MRLDDCFLPSGKISRLWSIDKRYLNDRAVNKFFPVLDIS